jgi:Endonuclease-reverse transcriptase/Reverse transcriptase (RNA-dependent DNA polymerase)
MMSSTTATSSPPSFNNNNSFLLSSPSNDSNKQNNNETNFQNTLNNNKNNNILPSPSSSDLNDSVSSTSSNTTNSNSNNTNNNNLNEINSTSPASTTTIDPGILTIFNLNIGHNLLAHNRPVLLEMLVDLNKPHIVILTETGVLDFNFINEMKSHGYDVNETRRSKSDVNAGGSAIFYNTDVFHLAQDDAKYNKNSNNIQIAGVRLVNKITNEPLSWASCYAAPQNTSKQLPNQEQLTAAVFETVDAGFFIAGDLNARHKEWEPQMSHDQFTTYPGNRGTALRKKMNEINFKVLAPSRPTCKKKSNPDVTILPIDLVNRTSLQVLDWNSSDHHGVLTSIVSPLLSTQAAPSRKLNNTRPRCRFQDASLKSKAAYAASTASNIRHHHKRNKVSVNVLHAMIHSAVDSAARTHIPTGSSRHRHHSYGGTKETAELISSGLLKIRSEDPEVRQQGQQDIRKAQTLLHAGAEKRAHKPGGMYELMRFMESFSGVASVIEHKRTLYKTPRQQAKMFSKMFAEKHHNSPGANLDKTLEQKRRIEEILKDVNMDDVPLITESEYMASIMLHVTGKSTDNEGLTAEHLLYASKEINLALVRLFNLVLTTGVVPKQWLESVIVPLLKPGKDPKFATSYRPVALTSIVCRTFERIIQQRAYRMIRTSPHQFGFKPNTPTEVPLSQVVMFMEDAFRSNGKNGNGIKNRNSVISISIDVTDAFCKVSRESVVTKFLEKGGHPAYARFIYNWMEDRSLKARVDGHLSPKVLLILGAPQGSILGPFLWLIEVDSLLDALGPVLESASQSTALYSSGKNTDYLNTYRAASRTNCSQTQLPPDALEILKSNQQEPPGLPSAGMSEMKSRKLYQYVGYADDIVALAVTTDPIGMLKNPNGVPAVVKCFGDWAFDHNIDISPKSKIHVFTSPTNKGDFEKCLDSEINNNEQYQIVCAGVKVPVTTEPMKFLGLHIDSNLNWNSHAEALVQKCESAIVKLTQASRLLNPSRSFLAYKYYIEPKITYALSMWWNSASQEAKAKIVSLRARAGRAILQAPLSTSTRNILDQLPLTPLNWLAVKGGVNLAAKVLARQNDCPARQSWLYNDTTKFPQLTVVDSSEKSTRRQYSRLLKQLPPARLPSHDDLPTAAEFAALGNVKFDTSASTLADRSSTSDMKKEANDLVTSTFTSPDQKDKYWHAGLDGSTCYNKKHGDFTAATAAFVLRRQHQHQVQEDDSAEQEITIKKSKQIGPGRSSYDAEGAAGDLLFNFLANEDVVDPNDDRPLVVYWDSLSWLLRLTKCFWKPADSNEAILARNILRVASKRPVHLIFVFSHCNFEINEEADEECKRAYALPLSESDVKNYPYNHKSRTRQSLHLLNRPTKGLDATDTQVLELLQNHNKPSLYAILLEFSSEKFEAALDTLTVYGKEYPELELSENQTNIAKKLSSQQLTKLINKEESDEINDLRDEFPPLLFPVSSLGASYEASEMHDLFRTIITTPHQKRTLLQTIKDLNLPARKIYSHHPTHPTPLLPPYTRRLSQGILTLRNGVCAKLGGWKFGENVPCLFCNQSLIRGDHNSQSSIEHLFTCTKLEQLRQVHFGKDLVTPNVIWDDAKNAGCYFIGAMKLLRRKNEQPQNQDDNSSSFSSSSSSSSTMSTSSLSSDSEFEEVENNEEEEFNPSDENTEAVKM